jgi:hypothetical protein
MRERIAWAVGTLGAVAVGVVLSAAGASADQPPGPQLSASSHTVVFDFVDVGSSSAAKSVTLGNVGSGSLLVNTVKVRGKNPADFHLVSDTCTGHSLAPNQTCQLSVVFRPTAPGTRVAYAVISDNTPCGEDSITLAGSGTSPGPSAGAAGCGDGTDTVPAQAPAAPAPAQPAPAAGHDVLGQQIVGLPTGKTCSSRRVFSVHLRPPGKTTFSRVSVMLNGKKMRTLVDREITSTVDLRNLPRGRFTLLVKAKTSDGKRYSRTRHYVTCVKPRS